MPNCSKSTVLVPAPYMARIYWIAAERWDVFRKTQWQEELQAARDLTSAKLPPKVAKALALPPAQLKRLVADRRDSACGKKGLLARLAFRRPLRPVATQGRGCESYAFTNGFAFGLRTGSNDAL